MQPQTPPPHNGANRLEPTPPPSPSTCAMAHLLLDFFSPPRTSSPTRFFPLARLAQSEIASPLPLYIAPTTYSSSLHILWHCTHDRGRHCVRHLSRPSLTTRGSAFGSFSLVRRLGPFLLLYLLPLCPVVARPGSLISFNNCIVLPFRYRQGREGGLEGTGVSP